MTLTPCHSPGLSLAFVETCDSDRRQLVGMRVADYLFATSPMMGQFCRQAACVGDSVQVEAHRPPGPFFLSGLRVAGARNAGGEPREGQDLPVLGVSTRSRWRNTTKHGGTLAAATAKERALKVVLTNG